VVTRLVMAACAALVVAAAVALAVGVSEPGVEPPIPIPVDPPPSAVRPMPETPHAVPADVFVAGPGGYAFADAVVGTGDTPAEPGRTMIFDYVAWQVPGPIVGTSYSRPAPNRVHLEAESSAWLAALAGARAGGIRQIRLPAEGRPGARSLVEVAVHDVLVPPGPVEVAPEARVRLPSGIEVADLVVGPGVVAALGHRATFEYAVFRADGSELDSSWRRASPVRVQLGRDRLTFESVLVGMTVGTRRQAWVPPDIAFPQGPPEGIPAGGTLVLVVELTALTIDVNNDDTSHTDGPVRDGH
jgi:FKBP-type peptidyl-prolyl cis-trans isomerase FkpA